MRAWSGGIAAVLLAALAGCANPPTAPAPALVAALAATPARPAPVAGVLAAGDQVEVFVWGYDDLTRKATVSYDGLLPYPLLGHLRATGKTPGQLEDEIRVGLRDYISAAVVRVSITSQRPLRLFVLGEVRTPGPYPLVAPDTGLVEVLAAAGGPTTDANEAEILVLRPEGGKLLAMPVDYRRMLCGSAPGAALTLRAGDIVYVPPSGLTDIARSARRVVDVITPVLAAQQVLLNLQASTLVWKDFLRALHGEDVSGGTVQNLIITPPR